MNTNTNISDKVKSILAAAVNTDNINEIASDLGVSVQTVVGSLATIKKDNLATYENKKLVLTIEGLAAINVTVKKKKNKDIVASLVQRNIELQHTDLVELIATTLGKTRIAARVYLYNYEKATGLRTVSQKAA
jgi:predicted transcriptional regulator